jgi:eukaryotic-like serine/threonine-protein kinase
MLDRDFGTYRLIRRLGRGGVADVYLARRMTTGAEVALKLIEQKPDRESREVCEAERRGAVLQQQFSLVDDHVPQVHGCWSIEEYFCIEMEYVDGEDLAERIARGAMAPDEAAWVAAEVCDFLQKAHVFEAVVDDTDLRGIIHADIKPKNVRINSAGKVKVLDFGIAKGLSLSRKLTRNDFGSLAYLSPERLDSGKVDVHVDFWSVGVVLYEMLAAVPPFEAETNSKLEALIRRREPPPSLPGSCPPALARIVLKMLAGDFHRRYQSAADIRSDLEAFRAGYETRADRGWLAESASEPTRRTTQGGPDTSTEPEATRRTVPVPGASTGSLVTGRTAAEPQGDAPFGTAPPAAAASVTRDRPTAVAVRASSRGPAAMIVRWLSVAAVLVGVGVVTNEAIVWSAARDLRVSVATGQGSEMHGNWDRYQDLSRRSLLGIGLIAVRTPLKERLLAQADRVIAGYRLDDPPVREAQWRSAATWLTDALHLDPGDRAATARLRYCEGQLQRLDGEARRRKKQSASEPLREAVSRFQEAARLDTRWSDPYLALARTYVYDLDDLDEALSAMREAEQRGYRPGNRELMQMADGYRNRADRMRREAWAATLLEHERACLRKAVDDYTESIDIYGKAIGFGEASGAMRLAQARRDEVRRRLDALQSQ